MNNIIRKNYIIDAPSYKRVLPGIFACFYPFLCSISRRIMPIHIGSININPIEEVRIMGAIAWHKRGRWVIVGKLIYVDGELAFGITVRHQHGTRRVISVPQQALRFAEEQGARWVYWCNDRLKQLRRAPLADFQRRGWLKPDGEIYFPLGRMESCPYHPLPYTTNTIYLKPESQEEPNEKLFD